MIPKPEIRSDSAPRIRQPSMGEIVSWLKSPDQQRHYDAMNIVRSDRRGATYELCNFIRQFRRDARMENRVADAMLLAGELRLDEAVPTLLEHLDFTLSLPAIGRKTAFSTTPAVRALIEIGLPALDPLLKKVGGSDDAVVVQRAAIIVDQMLGADLAVLYVQDRVRRETQPERAARLRRLAEQIDTVQRNSRHRSSVGPLKPPPEVPRDR